EVLQWVRKAERRIYRPINERYVKVRKRHASCRQRLRGEYSGQQSGTYELYHQHET
ncbi:unnamed protein product, partial [Ectocarpus sp. 12 AP-2014]